MKNDYQRSYRIDIETNSTLDVEATEDKQLIAEFMNAMAQLMNGVAPMVKENIMPFAAMKSMLLEIAQRFRFGRNVQEEINSMQEPQGPNPEAMQKQMEEAQKQVQQAQQKIQAESQQLEQAKKALDQQSMQLKEQVAQKMAEIEKREVNLQFREMELKHQQDLLVSQQPNTDLQRTEMEIASRERIAKYEADLKARVELQKAGTSE